jgi:uncharacterized protein (DUF952 family)
MIYKLLPTAAWRAARATGVYLGSEVDLADGYVHLSTAEQVVETAARHFAGQTDLTMLTVDGDRLGEALRFEPSRGGALFPHLYGPLPVDAVVAETPLASGLPVDRAVTEALWSAEQWPTPEEIAAARQRFEAAIPGWVAPRAYGLGRLAGDRVEFVRVNVAEHPLPAVVLATVCGHRGGSASYRLDAAGLARAVNLLAPAEVCTAYDHPNLAAWRRLLPELGDDSAVAVFVADLDRPGDDRHVAALVELARQAP